MEKQVFKDIFQVLAMKRKLQLDQLQHMEDYIDALYSDGLDAALPAPLNKKCAGDIRRVFIIFMT